MKKKSLLCRIGIHKDRLFDSKAGKVTMANMRSGAVGKIDGYANIFRCERCGKISAQLEACGVGVDYSVAALVAKDYYDKDVFPTYQQLVVMNAVRKGETT